MPFWSGEKIKENKHVIIPFSEEQIDCNFYTLKMGKSYYRTPDKESSEQKKSFLKEGEAFVIPAGQFAYLLSKETVNIPLNSMVFISMRTSIKFRGLINVSGFHVDPGYNGKLIFAVFNAGSLPIHICENDPIFKIRFCSMDRESGSGFAFNNRKSIDDISNDLIHGMSKEIFSLQNLADKIREQDNSVNAKLAEIKPSIDFLMFVWRAVTLSVVAATLIAIFTIAFPSMKRGGEAISEWLFQERASPSSTSKQQ